MEFNCRNLSSTTLNWNAAIGSIAAISLCTSTPAINLHTYKFYFARAIRFSVCRKNQVLQPESVVVTWYPHKMLSHTIYKDVVLDLEVFFVDAEIISVQYSFTSSCAMDLDVTTCGTARNGTSLDGYFHHRGRIVSNKNCCYLEQETDIPDYLKYPFGPARQHTHHHMWMIDADEPVTVSQDMIEHEHPERINLESNRFQTGSNCSNSWLIKKRLSLQSSKTSMNRFFIGARWLGPQRATARDIDELCRTIRFWKRQSSADIIRTVMSAWDELLGKLPMMKDRYQNNNAYRDLYLKAWICVFQNITGSLVTSRKTIHGPSVMVGKACSNGFGLAQWETSLAGFLISFVKPELGISVIESVLDSMEIDGFIPEDLIFNRDVKLSSYEPFMFEYIHRFTGKTDFLERTYNKMLQQLMFHLKHPCFYILDRDSSIFKKDSSFWLQAANFYSLGALRNIARILNKDLAELRYLDDLLEDTRAMLEVLEPDAERGKKDYFALYGFWNNSQTDDGLTFIRDHLIPPAGKHFLFNSPDGQKEGKEDPTAFTNSGYLILVAALEQLGAEDLLDMVVAKIFDGLKANGDFWECYYTDGNSWGNGPMSIFGAFGWIWCVMQKPNMLWRGLLPAMNITKEEQ